MAFAAGSGPEMVVLKPREHVEHVRPIVVSAIVNFHREGEMARTTLDGLSRVRQHAEGQGISVEFIYVLDRTDEQTANHVLKHAMSGAGDIAIGVQCGDPGISRNVGIMHARGEYAVNFDGDDLFSANWISGAVERARQSARPVVVHPQFIVSFGSVRSVRQLIDQEMGIFPDAALFNTHPWNGHVLAPTALRQNVPYQASGAATGFGYEDWHWALEVLSHGARHVTAPDTVVFYRRKLQGTLAGHSAANVLVRPSRFFADVSWATQPEAV